MNILRIMLWTFTNPRHISRVMDAAQSARTVRLTWCILISLAGLGLSLLLIQPANPWMNSVLPGIGVILILLTAVDIKESGTDSLGIMLLSVIPFVTAIPIRLYRE